MPYVVRGSCLPCQKEWDLNSPQVAPSGTSPVCRTCSCNIPILTSVVHEESWRVSLIRGFLGGNGLLGSACLSESALPYQSIRYMYLMKGPWTSSIPSVPLLPLCDASNRRCLDLNGVNTYLPGRVIRQARYSGDNGAQHFVLEIEIWLSAKRSSFEAAKDLGSFRSETLDPRPMPASSHSGTAYKPTTYLPPTYRACAVQLLNENILTCEDHTLLFCEKQGQVC